MAAREGDGTLLVRWLNLLGWTVETDRDGSLLIAVARHQTAEGSVLQAGACAATPGELASELFSTAMTTLDAHLHGDGELLPAA
jgi:hypothetical protein